MVVLALQLQTALQEADPAQDRAYRQRAEEFYGKLIAWLKRQDSMKKYRLLKYRAQGAGVDTVVYSYEISSKVLGLGKEYPRFFIVLAPFRTGTARFGKRGKDHAIILPVLTQETLESENGGLMAQRVGDVREVFIHEFTHYLDELRYKGKTHMASAELKKKGGEKGYFNSAVEFNAYFQGGASEAEKYAADLPAGKFATMFGRPGSGYRKFRKHYEHLFNKTFRRALEGKWKKKYEVRLWQLYQDMLERDRGTA